MREWYNGYRFAKECPRRPLQHRHGALFPTLKYAMHEQRDARRELIDTNVRIDYGKLRHLLTVNRQLNGNFDLLRHTHRRAEHPKQHPTQLPP